MDERTIENQPRETILVKRGLFYYIGQLIILPFKLLHALFSIIFGYANIYNGWVKESLEVRKKRKKLNKYMNMTKDEEII